MRIILAGGGGAPDSVPLGELFARWSAHGTVLYWPFASDTPPEACLRWFESTYGPLGIHDTVVWYSLDEMEGVDLHAYSAIYIGGGNTFSLLESVRRVNAAEPLADFARDGGVIYGGSAGAILLGSDISTASHADSNDVGLQETTGLDMALGHAIWCHYRPAQLPMIQEWSRDTRHPVLALSERAGIVREADLFWVVGFDPVLQIKGEDTRELQLGEQLTG